ncbi:hypothetical protein A6302_02123 [Methylobrevis pamukkalensis]|uniref:DUF2442 domain-containing protein n=2 Tax=Methylobrevis pamukkalensis TaxID=1439726 RepID=A0A1E3H4S8_9HYPH|nr:hypothetical protein A6302_02123 [Methylobrevis pamukkalensis]
MHGVLRLDFLDGYVGVVDLRPWIARGKIFTWLQDPEHFSDFTVDEFGHHVTWRTGDGHDIDFGADNLRRECERQAEIHRLMLAG